MTCSYTGRVLIERIPDGALRLFVQRLWFSATTPTAPYERVLPTGGMHLVVRLDDAPLHVVGAGAIGTAIVGGPRSSAYVKDVARPVRSVGAWLRPGAALPLLGAPASAFAERHTSLADVWGRAANELRARICEARTPVDALATFAAALAARLPAVRGIDPLVAHALARFDADDDVAAVVDASGYSHRRFLTRFREVVGLAPKRYCRVQRFQRALAATAAHVPLARVAAVAGYADQAHFTREFRALAGISPRAYRDAAPARAHHVPSA